MAARTADPAQSIPGALDALRVFESEAGRDGLPRTTIELAHLRASQMGGCGDCVRMHTTDLEEAGESDERIRAVAAWRSAAGFTAMERAALALTEAVIGLSDSGDPVPAEIFDEAARHFEEPALAALILHITLIGASNRTGMFPESAGSGPLVVSRSGKGS